MNEEAGHDIGRGLGKVIEVNGGDLYRVPIRYDKSKTTNTPCTQKSSEQDTKLNEVPKATWKKISRPGLPINREVTRDRVSVGKKRQAEHRAIKDGQDNKTSNKRLKGVAETTQPTSPTVVAVSQPADRNDCPELELPRAWEPLGSGGPRRFGEEKRSHNFVSHGNRIGSSGNGNDKDGVGFRFYVSSTI